MPIALLYMMAALYVVAGLNHFRRPRMYERIIPPIFPARALLNKLAGLVEIVLGAGLCHPQSRPWAAWGIIALLIAVFPANIYMASPKGAPKGIPRWVLWARLPLQGVLIAWAYAYTGPPGLPP